MALRRWRRVVNAALRLAHRHGRQRVALVHQFDQPSAVDMGIDLRCPNIGMAQHRLQSAQVRAAFQQMRRKSMTQNMWADPLRRDPRRPGQRLH